MFFFRARAEKGIVWHIDASSVVWTLTYHGELANQIARLAAIVVKNGILLQGFGFQRHNIFTWQSVHTTGKNNNVPNTVILKIWKCVSLREIVSINRVNKLYQTHIWFAGERFKGITDHHKSQITRTLGCFQYKAWLKNYPKEGKDQW